MARLRRECDLSPAPALLLAAVSAALSIWLLVQTGDKEPTVGQLAGPSAAPARIGK
jgi:hypothetical protein